MSNFPRRPWMVADDLAPGDRKSLLRDWSELELEIIESHESPFFTPAFDALWAEFSAAGEMERREVLAERMSLNPAAMVDGSPMLYQMMLVRSGDRIAGVTDQTAILPAGGSEIIVHHSHILLAPEWRRTGLAGWLRALPLATARAMLQALGRAPTAPVTIAGEMEHPDPSDPATLVRLAAMEKAGYKKVDPARVRYLQPDFRTHHEIDLDGPQPVPLSLVLRRVGRETEDSVTGAMIREIVTALYEVFSPGMRAKDMTVVHASLDNYPDGDEQIRLIPPTA